MKQGQDHQKSYLDQKRQVLEFPVGDKVFVKVASYKNVIRFDRKGKLASRFVRLFEVLKCVGKVIYRLKLLASMNYIHNVFHVSLLCKYISNLTHVLSIKDV